MPQSTDGPTYACCGGSVHTGHAEVCKYYGIPVSYSNIGTIGLAYSVSKMRRVILESPFGSPDPDIVRRNQAYARAALYDSLRRGEAPIASHLLYPQVLDDNNPDERQWGIDAGLEWRSVAEATVVYTDYGISKGMAYGIQKAQQTGIPIEYRKLPNGDDL